MTIQRSSSTTSLMPQVPKPTPTSIWGAFTSLFIPRGSPHHDESQQTEHQESLPLFVSSQTTDSSSGSVPPSQITYSSPSQRVAGPSELPSSPDALQRSRPVAESNKLESQSEKRFPSVIARDFVNVAPPPLRHHPIDERWIVPVLPRGAVPGVRERAAAQWEALHTHLYRLQGNRADPPNTIPKTWGGLSKAEDDEMMHRAQARITGAKARALALGLTPTEPNIEGPPQNYSSMDGDDLEAAARADASVHELMVKSQKEGHGPLVKTPPNTPPPPSVRPHARNVSHPPSPARPRTPLPMTTRRSKRKRVEASDIEHDHKRTATTKRLSSKRHHIEDEATATKGVDGTIARYSLRSRPTSSQTSDPKPSTNSKGKRKAKAS